MDFDSKTCCDKVCKGGTNARHSQSFGHSVVGNDSSAGVVFIYIFEKTGVKKERNTVAIDGMQQL